ncbi:MAG: DUF2092 domain-containing protein [Candidatus Sumerlaeaceae bacterium]|nr:DUF2092 domain-containing protein [Candidatus Sumerlaeaceae bacterium]
MNSLKHTGLICATLIGFAVICTGAFGARSVDDSTSIPVTAESSKSGDSTTKAVLSDGGLKIGLVSDDPATSEAVTRLLADCAAAYGNAQSFYARGTCIEATKRLKGPEVKESAKIRVYYRRPNLLRIVLENKYLSSEVVADGTTVTMLWPNDRQYRQIAQPAGLDAFSESERAGAILEEETGALMRSMVGCMLITDNPLAWLHANVIEYLYEGTEDVSGKPTWRVRFNQTNPNLVVTNWIDQKTAFLRKVSIVQGLDERGGFVGSYKDAAIAQLRLVILDEISTAPDRVKDSDFTARIPAKWTERKRVIPQPPKKDADSGWSRFLRAAAAQSGAVTTVSLETAFGAKPPSVAWFKPVNARPLGVALVKTGEKPVVAFGTTAGRVGILDATGKLQVEFAAGIKPDFMVASPAGDLPAVMGVERYSGRVAHWDVSGNKRWEYNAEQTLNAALYQPTVGTSEPLIRLGGTTGLITLDLSGKVKFTSRQAARLWALDAWPIANSGWSVVATSSEQKLIFYNREGRCVQVTPLDDLAGPVVADGALPAAPLFYLGTRDRGDTFLRRIQNDGGPIFTSGVAVDAGQTEPVGLGLMTMADKKKAIAAVLDDGRLAVFSTDGTLLWRGSVKSQGDSNTRSGEPVLHGMATGDLDGDGLDELVLTTNGGVVSLRFGGPAN